MSHQHAHHGHVSQSHRKKLIFTFILTSTFCIVEFIGGIYSHSLALISDAGHMLIDMSALAFVLLGVHFSRKPPSSSKTFGYYRMEILSALINGGLLLFIAFEILRSALYRFGQPHEIETALMMLISVAGLGVNLACMLILKHHHEHLGTKSAYYHVISDFISSIGAIVAACLIAWMGWLWIDPLVSIFIAVLILWNAKKLIFESADILLEGVPSTTPIEKVKETLEHIEGVEGVHDLHIWTIGSGFVSATAHLLVFPMNIQESEQIVRKAADVLKVQFKITHSTFQVESTPPPRSLS